MSKYLVLPTPLLKADYHFLVLLSSGSFFHQIGIENYHITAPSLLFVPEGEAFSIKSIHDDLSGYFIMLENKSISSAVIKMELADLLTIETNIKLDADSNLWLNNICNLLFNEVASNKPNRNIGTGLLQALLYKLKDLSGNKKTLSRQNEMANSFKQMVNEHYKAHKLVDFYAKELGISENYLNRCVKAHFNKNSKQIILDITILQSQILMFNPNRDISEICFDVGFDDPSYFSRIFKKVTGLTPTEFKKQILLFVTV